MGDTHTQDLSLPVHLCTISMTSVPNTIKSTTLTSILATFAEFWPVQHLTQTWMLNVRFV